MSLTRHTTLTLAGHAASLAMALLTVPSYLDTVGEARYGVLAITWLVIGYVGLLDMGLGAATAQRLSRVAPDHDAGRGALFWSALLTGTAVSAAGALALWPLAHLGVTHALPLQPALREELQAGVPWLVVTVPLVAACNVLAGALQARERFLELSVATVLSTAGMQALPLLTALWISTRLDALLLSVLVGRLGHTAYLAWCCRQHVVRSLPVMWRRAAVGDLLSYGGWASITAVVGPLMVLLDRLLIGATLGARAVSHYTIPFQLAERLTMPAAALSHALLPRLARALAGSQRHALEQGALQLLGALLTPLVALAMVLVEPFLSAWINVELAATSTPVALVLLFGFWFNSLAFVPYTVLQAAGRPDIIARCHLAECLPYVGLLILGLQEAGLVGASAVFALRAAVDFALLAHFGGLLRPSRRLWLPAAGLLLIMSQSGQGVVASWACAVLCVHGAWHARCAFRQIFADPA